MTMDAGAIIGLISLVASLVAAAFRAGVAVGRQKEKVERFSHELEGEEHRSIHKNDRR